MPLTRLKTGLFSTPAQVMAVNGAIDKFNKDKTGLDLDKVQAVIDVYSRTSWGSQTAELLKLESEIGVEKRAFAAVASAAGPSPFAAKAAVDLTPTRWFEELSNAPPLHGVQFDGEGKKGAQGSTYKMVLPRGQKLFGKTARSADKENRAAGGELTETEREYNVYKRVYASVGRHPNLANVWGWASMLVGRQQEVGFIMDRIDGPDGRSFQGQLKEHWDLGIISSAEYWSSVQYIGRVHIDIVLLLQTAGWVHNDIKPENYVIDSTTGEVVVIDLGGASLQGEQWNAVTNEYTAPELRNGGQIAAKGTKGTTAADLFAIGATIAHAAEAAQAFHGVAKPNQGLRYVPEQRGPDGSVVRGAPAAYTSVRDKVLSKSLTDPTADPKLIVDTGAYKNSFQFGAHTAYTRQMQRLMNDDPLERMKTLTSVDDTNSFFTDSILNPEQVREVLKGVASGERRQQWEARWRAAGKQPPKAQGLDRMSLTSKLRDKMRQFGGNRNYGGADLTALSREQAGREEVDLNRKMKEIEEVVLLIKQANAFGIPTGEEKRIINAKLLECERKQRLIAQALGRPVPVAIARV